MSAAARARRPLAPAQSGRNRTRPIRVHTRRVPRPPRASRLSASISAAVSTSGPRLVLIRIASGCIFANRWAFIKWRVSGVNGACRETTWLSASSSSSGTSQHGACCGSAVHGGFHGDTSSMPSAYLVNSGPYSRDGHTRADVGLLTDPSQLGSSTDHCPSTRYYRRVEGPKAAVPGAVSGGAAVTVREHFTQRRRPLSSRRGYLSTGEAERVCTQDHLTPRRPAAGSRPG